MHIGVITYRKYEENVLLNKHFSTAALFDIARNDKDFVRFEIFDRDKNLLLSSFYPNVKQHGVYIKFAKVEKEETITGITYDGYRTPSTIYRTKVRWKADGARFRIKKIAVEFAASINRKSAEKIEQFIDRG